VCGCCWGLVPQELVDGGGVLCPKDKSNYQTRKKKLNGETEVAPECLNRAGKKEVPAPPCKPLAPATQDGEAEEEHPDAEHIDEDGLDGIHRLHRLSPLCRNIATILLSTQ
jgi:hypothetical protein